MGPAPRLSMKGLNLESCKNMSALRGLSMSGFCVGYEAEKTKTFVPFSKQLNRSKPFQYFIKITEVWIQDLDTLYMYRINKEGRQVDLDLKT